MAMLTLIQLFGWQKQLDNKWNSNAKEQYYRMQKSLIRSCLVICFIGISSDICTSGGHLIIKMFRELNKWNRLFLLYFILSFTLIFNNEICPSENAQIFVKNFFQVNISIRLIVPAFSYI